MFQIDSASRVPIYEQLKKSVIRFAATGVLKPHDKLPAVRSLALELGINPNTVAKAYKELEQEGYTYSVTGKGSFLSERGGDGATEKVAYQVMRLCDMAKESGVSEEKLHEMIGKSYKGGYEKYD